MDGIVLMCTPFFLNKMCAHNPPLLYAKSLKQTNFITSHHAAIKLAKLLSVCYNQTFKDPKLKQTRQLKPSRPFVQDGWYCSNVYAFYIYYLEKKEIMSTYIIPLSRTLKY
jgi:hypothetical protein